MLVHRRVIHSFIVTSIRLYTWVERLTVTVECLAQGHNTMSQARALIRTVQSGIERTNHEATAPHTSKHVTILIPTCYFRLWLSMVNKNLNLGIQQH